MIPVFSHYGADDGSLVQLRCFLLSPEHLQPSATWGERQTSVEPKGLISEQLKPKERAGHEPGLG